MTEEAKKLIAGMDDLLNDKPEPRPATLAEFWAGSATQSVINCYKRGEVVDV
jgi:hypothetical protein